MIDKEMLDNVKSEVGSAKKNNDVEGSARRNNNVEDEAAGDGDTDDDDQELDPMSFLPLASLCRPRALYSSIYALLGVTGKSEHLKFYS